MKAFLVSFATLFLFFLTACRGASETNETDDGGHKTSTSYEAHHDDSDDHAAPVDAILFPIFILTLGAVTYRLLSRYAVWFPYTAAMFVIGTAIGAGIQGLDNPNGNLLHESIVNFWLPIDSEVLLVSFLPGLVFHDAANQNTHLFRVAFDQCLLMAFPMVLAGTCLTALVGFYIFPYNWSFNLSMVFGAILAATDPVAVAALLDSVGAPPRLKVHIAGESLLNDGSAIVFFTIFSQLFFLELGVEGVGEDIDWGGGIKLFLQMSLGGACIGVFFGLGLLAMLYLLNRSLDREENVVQVGLTFTLAYLCYFVAEVAWGCSGVISVVTMGVLVTAFGMAYLNDRKLMEDFWSIIEWLLNTVLFALGGLVWGSIIANSDEEFPEREFNAKDWGYLFLLYGLLTVIRFFLFAAFFPVTSRIGLKSNWKELIFQAFGGLRGAVGISLAIVVDNTVKSYSDETDEKYVLQTNKLFGMVGGIAFLTLCVNGVAAGPLLKRLGLADTTETRKRILHCYHEHFRRHAVLDLVQLLGEHHFKKINFDIVRNHVPFLEDMTSDEILDTARKIYETKEAHEVLEKEDEIVNVDGRHFYFDKADHQNGHGHGHDHKPKLVVSSGGPEAKVLSGRLQNTPSMRNLKEVIRKKGGDPTINEMRRLFLELVRAGYQKQIAAGELVDHEFVVLSLIESLEMAVEDVESADRICDWDYVFALRYPHMALTTRVQKWCCLDKCCKGKGAVVDRHAIKIQMDLEKCIAFVRAHTAAQKLMQEEFSEDADLESIDEKIIQESQEQVKKAEGLISFFPQNEVSLAISHKACKIILNSAVKFIEHLVETGLLKETEASESFEEIQEALFDLDTCSVKRHPEHEEGSCHTMRDKIVDLTELDKLSDERIEETDVNA